MANRATQTTKQMLKFAVIRGYIEANPLDAVTATSIGGQERPRNAHLSYKDIWRVWHEANKLCNPYLMYAIRLLLLTGQPRANDGVN